MGGDVLLVRECPGNSDKDGIHCELWPYRLGRNPNIILSEEEKRIRSGRFNHPDKWQMAGRLTA
jgi:hypothetical protein